MVLFISDKGIHHQLPRAKRGGPVDGIKQRRRRSKKETGGRRWRAHTARGAARCTPTPPALLSGVPAVKHEHLDLRRFVILRT